MTKTVINSQKALYDHIEDLRSQFDKHKYLVAVIKSATKLDIQNRWIQQFYNMVSKQSGQPRQDLINHCKYYHGMPIILLDSPKESSIWRQMMGVLTEEDRLTAMKKTAVTSLFDMKEASQYIKELISHFDNWELPKKDWKE